MRHQAVTTTLIAVALGSVLAAGADAARNCKVDLEPMLRVHSDRQVRLRSIRLPPPPYRVVEDLVVSRGGATSFMFSQFTLCSPPCGGGGPARQFVAGRASSTRLEALKAVFTTREVTQEPACLIANDYSLPTGVVNHGSALIEWYGNPGPTQLFRVFWGDVENFGGVPLCTDSDRDALAAIAAFEQGTRGGGLQPLQCPLP